MGMSLLLDRSTANDSLSTVRPIKNVDKTRTSRLSADFMGSGSVRRQTTPHEIVPPVPRRQPITEKGRAGEVLVEEVILGVLDSVSFYATDES